MAEPPKSGTAGGEGMKSRVWQSLRAMGVLLRLGLRADTRLVIAFFVIVAIWQVSILGRVYATKMIVDAALIADLRAVTVAALAYALASGVLNQCARSHLSVAYRVLEKTSHVVDRELMEIIGRLPGLQHHEDPRYQNEVSLLRSQRQLLAGMTNAVVQNVRFWLQLLGATALLAQLHPLLPLLPLFGAVSFWTGKKAQEWEVRTQEATAERRRLRGHLFGLATTAAAGKELRLFDTSETVIARHEALSAEVERETNRTAWKVTALGALGSLGFAAGYLGAIGLVLLRALNGEASPGDVVLAISLASQLNETVEYLVGMANYLRNALRAATRYLWLLNYAGSAAPRPPDAAPVPNWIERGITLEGLAFSYPQTETTVLSDVSLHLPAGSVVAFVGENGAGKTTLVKLLCRFYEPSAGRILLDGTDLRRLDVAAWRQRLSTGFQDFSRFEFTLRDAVGVGNLARRTHVPALEHALTRAGAGGWRARSHPAGRRSSANPGRVA
jgi:ATP-binding cassette, subfamily B, bacterial